MANKPLGELLQNALIAYPHAIAAIGAEGAAPQELVQRADEIARQLRDAGVAADEPVMMTIRTEPADLASFLGIWKVGGVAVPIHANAASITLQGVQDQTGTRFFLRDGQLHETGNSRPPPRPLLVGAALIIFTSGSTGKPKGVVIDHERFVKKLGVLLRLLEPTPSDHLVVPLQLTFIFGLWTTLLALASHARLTLVSRFSVDHLKVAFDNGATILTAVPSMLRTLMSGTPPSSPALRLILTGGESLGPALTGRIRNAYPTAGIFDLYGLTETGSCDFRLAPHELKDGMGSIGFPTDEIAFRIMGSSGPVSTGDVGELQIATPFAMMGYLDQPELTASSFADDHFRTGDLARQRSDGRIELVGRTKELISRGGNKISPLEIDHLIASHPNVSAALCAGIPDERLGEAIYAVVVPKLGASVSTELLRAWLSERIERFKVPDVIEVAEALPTGPTGKASRTALIERIAKGAK
jgi:long-chain acyl-CoA synthetase